MSWDIGGIFTPHMSWGLLGGIHTSLRHFCVCWYIQWPLVHYSHTSYSWSLWVASFLDGMPMDVCYTSWCWLVPFCSVSIMSEASTTKAMTTTPPVIVVSSSMSSLLSMVTMAPSLMRLLVTSGQHDALPPLLTPRNFGGVVGLATVLQQQAKSQMPLQVYANYAMGPSWVGFSFRVECPTILYIICLVSVLVYAFCFQVPCWMLYSSIGAQLLGLHHCNPLELTHGRHMCSLTMVIDPHQLCTEWLLLHCLSRGNLLLPNQLSSSHSNYMVGHTAFGAWQRVTQSLNLPWIVRRGLVFQVWFHLITQSALSLQWALNLVILVWWLGIRLISLLTPGLQSGFLLVPTFIMGS